MDIQEEREAFEKYCFEVFLMSPSDGHFDRELQDPEFYESVDTHRLWKLWQAKAQAVPEGCLLMPRKCTNKMAHAAKAVDGRLSAFKYADVYGAMVEAAQEQTND